MFNSAVIRHFVLHYKIINKILLSEAAVQSCSVKKVFLESSQNSWENTCARVSFLTKLQAFL